MGKQLGSNAMVEVSQDGATWLKAFRVKKASFPLKNNKVDSTDNDDQGSKGNLYGDQSVDIAFTCNYDPSDAGQLLIKNSKISRQKIFMRYRSRGTGTGLDQTYGACVVEEATYDSEHEKLQEFVVKASSDGPWSENVQ